jgi:chromosome segregation ATPase
VSLKDELLRLLKEDEEFRLAVIGLLGITDVQAALKRLIDIVAKLADNQTTMLTTLNSVLTALGGLTDTVQRLWQEIEKLWGEVKALREGQEKIWQEIKALREDQERLWREVKALREGEEKLWEEVKALRENQEKLWLEVKSLREGQEALWREVRSIRRDLRDVKSTLEKYSVTIEEEANDTVQYYLRQRGVVIETKPTVLNGTYEFDIYGTNGAITVVSEAKVRASPRTVERVYRRIEEAIRAMPDKFPGRVVKVLYCLRVSPNTLEAANKYGIWLLESGIERNAPPLP